MAEVLISHSEEFGIYSEWDGELLGWFQQGDDFTGCSFHVSKSRWLLVGMGCGVQGRAEGRRPGLYHCSGLSRDGGILESSCVLPSALIKSLLTAPPHALKGPCHLGTEPALGHPTEEFQKVRSCVHKKNKCGIGHCLVCVLV